MADYGKQIVTGLREWAQDTEVKFPGTLLAMDKLITELKTHGAEFFLCVYATVAADIANRTDASENLSDAVQDLKAYFPK